MNDSSQGPVSTLPGHITIGEWNESCEVCFNPAPFRMQGETDSFGCEYLFFCRNCLTKERATPRERCDCDWCGTNTNDWRDTRDYDEGLYGRIYRVCRPCLDRRNEEARAELDWTEWQ